MSFSVNRFRLWAQASLPILSSSLARCLVAGSKSCCQICCSLEELNSLSRWESVRMRPLDVDQMVVKPASYPYTACVLLPATTNASLFWGFYMAGPMWEVNTEELKQQVRYNLLYQRHPRESEKFQWNLKQGTICIYSNFQTFRLKAVKILKTTVLYFSKFVTHLSLLLFIKCYLYCKCSLA